MTDRTYIVGLGNPGDEYVRTPHNLGFRVLDHLAREHGLSWGFPRNGCRVASGRIDGYPVILIQPQRYMNRSGEALADWARRDPRIRVAPDGRPEFVPLVVCDDIALPLGALRLRSRGSDGGHKGLSSIGAAGWGIDYPRMRLGVARRETPLRPADWADFVLEDFSARDWEASRSLVAYAGRTVIHYLAHGPEATASRFNRREFPESG